MRRDPNGLYKPKIELAEVGTEVCGLARDGADLIVEFRVPGQAFCGASLLNITQPVRDGIRKALEEQEPGRTRYWVHENYAGQWHVIRGDGTEPGDHVACFEPSHPCPQATAEAEAARLNDKRDGEQRRHLFGSA